MDIDELHVVIERMKRRGVLPILDYAVEEDVPKNDQYVSPPTTYRTTCIYIHL